MAVPRQRAPGVTLGAIITLEKAASGVSDAEMCALVEKNLPMLRADFERLMNWPRHSRQCLH